MSPRDAARLLDAVDPTVVNHRQVRDLPSLIRPGDVIVVNDTKVIPARLALHKPTGGAAEVLLLEPVDQAAGNTGEWKALVPAKQTTATGIALCDERDIPVLRVGDDLGEGVRLSCPAH